MFIRPSPNSEHLAASRPPISPSLKDKKTLGSVTLTDSIHNLFNFCTNLNRKPFEFSRLLSKTLLHYSTIDCKNVNAQELEKINQCFSKQILPDLNKLLDSYYPKKLGEFQSGIAISEKTMEDTAFDIKGIIDGVELMHSTETESQRIKLLVPVLEKCNKLHYKLTTFIKERYALLNDDEEEGIKTLKFNASLFEKEYQKNQGMSETRRVFRKAVMEAGLLVNKGQIYTVWNILSELVDDEIERYQTKREKGKMVSIDNFVDKSIQRMRTIFPEEVLPVVLSLVTSKTPAEDARIWLTCLVKLFDSTMELKGKDWLKKEMEQIPEKKSPPVSPRENTPLSINRISRSLLDGIALHEAVEPIKLVKIRDFFEDWLEEFIDVMQEEIQLGTVSEEDVFIDLIEDQLWTAVTKELTNAKPSWMDEAMHVQNNLIEILRASDVRAFLLAHFPAAQYQSSPALAPWRNL